MREWLPLVGSELYAYVKNAPLQYSDPTGLTCLSFARRGALARAPRPSDWSQENVLISMREDPWVPRIPFFMRGRVPVAGGARFYCYWAKYLVVTSYWKRTINVTVACDCPFMIQELSYEQDEKVVDRYRGSTFETSSVNRPCAPLTNLLQ